MHQNIIQAFSMMATSLESSLDYLLTHIPTIRVEGGLEGKIQISPVNFSSFPPKCTT